MNKATTPRHWAMGVLTLMCLVVAQRVSAQCSDFISVPPGPVTINLTLGVGGTVNLNNAVLNGNGFTKNAACDYWLAEKAVLDANFTDSTNAAFYTNTPVTFNCSDVGASQKWYVRAGGTVGSGGIGTLGGPGATIYPITINVLDNIPPVITFCPANAARNVDAGQCNYTTIGGEFDPVATDNCAVTSFTYALTGATTLTANGTLGGDDFNPGITTVTWTVSDASNNTATCSFTVTVSDTENPAIGPCLANASASTDPGNCSAVLSFTQPPSSDNCTVASVTWSAPGAIPPSGAGNITSVIFPQGVTSVTYNATDGSGNAAVPCNFSVTVNDTQVPSIVGTPANQPAIGTSTGTATPGNLCDGSYSWNHPSITDNCAGPNILTLQLSGATVAAPVVVTQGAAITQLFNLGTTVLTYKATDINGQTSVASFSVTVVDNAAPVVSPAPTGQNFNYTVTAGDCSKVVTFTRPSEGAVSDCGSVTFTETVLSGPDPLVLSGAPVFPPMGGGSITVQFPAGVTIIRYKWADNVGNEVHVDYTFDIEENEPPNANCTASTITLILDPQIGVVLLDPSTINNGSTDNCGIASIKVFPTIFDCTMLGLNPVTLTVTDETGNTDNCTASVFVLDNTSPVVSCPGNLTVPANGMCQGTVGDLVFTQAAPIIPITVGPKEYFDNALDPCGVSFQYKINAGAFTTVAPGMFSEYDLSGLVFNTGTSTVTVRVLDGSNNAGTCSFTVNVTDQAGPTFTPVAGPPASPLNGSTINLNTTANGCGQFFNWSWPTVSDACSNPVTTVLQTHQPNAFFPLGNTTVTWLAKDNAGNIGTYTFVVNVKDVQPPVAKCKNATLNLDGSGSATLTTAQVDNASTDNCFFTLSLSKTNFTCADLGTQIVTLTATDGGVPVNTSTCTATITVQDLIPPTVACQAGTLQVNVSGASATIVPSQIYATIGDNCIAKDSIKLDAGAYAKTLTVGCPQIGAHVVTVKVTDNAGNTATCQRNIQVNDTGVPVITVPGPLTVSCDVYYAQVPFNSGTATATDNCATPIITYSDAFNPPTCVNGFTITRTWKASDGVNMSTATQLITVQDITKPVFTMTSSIVVPSTTGPNGMPACSAPLTVTVQDSDISDNCTADANMTFSYFVDYPAPPNNFGYTDAGSLMSPIPGKSVGPNFPLGVTVITFIARDECGNTSTHSVTVQVNDAVSPLFSYSKCDQHIVLPNTSGACSNLYSWVRPWSAVPNVTDCQSFTVKEDISNATVQQSINLSNPFQYNGLFFQVFATAQFPVGITTVTYTAKDASNNVSVCSFTVEIQDTQVPSLVCPGNQVFNATCPTAQVPDYRNLVLVSDNCPGNVVLTQTFAPGTTLDTIFSPNPPASGNTFPITIQGQDAYNSTSCTFNVTLQDGQAPIPTLATLPPLVDSCGGVVIEAPTANDPCNPNASIIYGSPSTPVGTFIPGVPPKYNLQAGNYVITWVYNDGNGNISTQSQNITVLNDIFPPVALCKPSFSVDLSNLGVATVSLNQIDNGSYDPNDCGVITMSLVNSVLDCSDIGDATVELIVTDAMNNKDTCSVTVTVHDVTPPLLSQPAVIPPIEACSPIPPAATLSAVDKCDLDVEIAFTETSTQDTIGFGKYNYTITRLWVASDTSGNTATAIQVLTIQDTQAPVFNVNAPSTLTVNTAANALTCNAAVTLNIAPYVTDCATGADLTITSTGGIGTGADVSGVYSVGTHVIVFTAKDASNNTSTHSVTIVVNDVTPPIAVCINGVSAALQPSGTVTVTTNQFNNHSFDNCTGELNLVLNIQRLDDNPLQTPSATLEYNCADADGSTHHPVRLSVADQYGNMSMCETYIVIQDNVNPTITFCPPSKTVFCTDDLSPDVQQYAQATDNCPDNVTVTFSDASADPDSSSMACYLVNRTWTAHDLAGNTATCVQTFSVLDTVAPVLSAYNPDITISCSEVLPGALAITATDNCSLNVPVQLQEDTINVAQGPCGKYSYTIARTRTAVDDCGNTTVHVRYITVVDTTAPSFPGLPDTIKIYSANNPPNNNCTVPVSFNVGQYLFDCSDVSEMLVINDAPYGNDSLDASGNYPVGSYMIHFYATDACGNVGQDSLVLEVIDNSIPTVICNNNVVVSLGSNGTATILPDDINLNSVDNCAIDTMYLDQSTFDCGDLGQNPVTLTVVDVSGNLNTCTVNVNVTLGVGSGLSVDAQGTNESFYGAADGTATVIVTGGSGNLTYLWNTDEFTTSISGLTEGTYTVTVYDQNSGCQQIDSVAISAGAKIKLTVGDVDGAQGQTVSVPVTVNNFTSVEGFSFTVNVLNPVVGTVLGVSGVDASISANLQVSVLAGNNLGVLWTDLNPLTLPNGTILFYVDVQLSNAPLGSISPVNVVGAPVVLNFTVEGSGGPVDVPIDQMNGTVEITQLVNTDVTLAGDIKTWMNPENPNSVEKPVANVTVTLAGAVSATEITTAAGTYDFPVPLNVNTLTSCNKVTVGPPFNAGVTAGDLLRIVNHIFGETLPSPYQWIAADVNNSKTVTLADYLLIQRLALGTDQHLMNSPDWKFVPKSYVFPAINTVPFGPLTQPFPQFIEHNPTDQDYLDDDFVAIRMGDVNGNTPVTFTNDDADDRSNETFLFRLTDRGFNAGDLVTIPFKASDFTNRRAYQMTINFDPTVFELTDMQAGVLKLTEDNFGTSHLADGLLTTLWVNHDPLTLADDEVLFTVTFRALRGSSALSKVIHVGSEITRAEAYDLNGKTMKVDFEFVQPLNGQPETEFALYQNQPNPFREGTSIGFRLPESSRATLRVFNAAGQLVKLVVGNFDQGYNEIRFQQSDLGTPGVYWYELETPTHSDRKKMILIN